MSLLTKSFLITLLLVTNSVGQPSFTDVTSSSGVSNSGGHSAESRLSTSAAWGDYDNDGDMDLYVTNWGQSLGPMIALNRLYRNNGNGSFSDVAVSMGVADVRNSNSAVWGDYDNDGDLDLYVVNFDVQDQLYRNDGARFSRVTGAAAINVISQGSETAAAWGDYDGDGDLDLYLCKYYFQNSLYRNNGNGTFSELASSAGVDDVRDSYDASWCDYDGDGDLDLYVVNQEQNNALYQNDGDGSFTEVACDLSVDNTDIGRNARWIDFDNDGFFDLFLANMGANALYRNNGNNQFQNIASGDIKITSGSWHSWESAWGDFDADGLIDLVVASGRSGGVGYRANPGQTTVLLTNNGAGSFTEQTGDAGLRTAAGSGTGVESVDYDGDGDLDLYIVESSFRLPSNTLYRNETTGVSTVKVRVRRKAAGDGIGAAVRLVSSGVTVALSQIGAQNPQEVVFGVSSGSNYDIEVTFADGSTANRSGVSAGSTVQINQP